MELSANLCIFEDVVRATGAYRPGILRVDTDGVAFTENGKTELEQLGANAIASVSITNHLLGADDVIVVRKSGGAWSIKVKGGAQVVDALRAIGIAVKR